MRPLRLPHPPEESLLLGSALAMRRPNHHRALRQSANQLGEIFAIRVAHWHVRCSRAGVRHAWLCMEVTACLTQKHCHTANDQ